LSNFNDFNLDEKLLKALKELGYEEPTPVQQQAIPKALEGSDIICSAQTGTGKTAAFMLPSLQRMISTPRGKANRPRILVLAPTRELAMQISSVTEKYTKHLFPCKTLCIYGGAPYPLQNRMLSRPYEILVATPGRLLDHMQEGRIDLSDVECLILDEADRMLDMGFIDDVERIAKAASRPDRQTLLFSATIDNKIQRLSKNLQKDPEQILLESSRKENVNIEQKLYFVDNFGHKMRLLDHILENTEIEQAIIFISTRNHAETLAEELQEKGYNAGALHGDMRQGQRTRIIGKLRNGSINFLVATDVAARGIDILTISHVINIDLPFQPEDYIHRIGRTGRAGGTGVAITFATYKEEKSIFKINEMMGSPMASLTIEGLEPSAKGKQSDPSKKGARGQRRGPRQGAGNRFRSGPKNREFGKKPKQDFEPGAREDSKFAGKPRGPKTDSFKRREEGEFKFSFSKNKPKNREQDSSDGKKFGKKPMKQKTDSGFFGNEKPYGKKKPFGGFKKKKFARHKSD